MKKLLILSLLAVTGFLLFNLAVKTKIRNRYLSLVQKPIATLCQEPDLYCQKFSQTPYHIITVQNQTAKNVITESPATLLAHLEPYHVFINWRPYLVFPIDDYLVFAKL